MEKNNFLKKLLRNATGGAKEIKEAVESNIKARRQMAQLARKLYLQLPGSSIMGNKNYGTAVRKVKDLTKRSDLQGAREYVKDQNRKVMQESRSAGKEIQADSAMRRMGKL